MSPKKKSSPKPKVPNVFVPTDGGVTNPLFEDNFFDAVAVAGEERPSTATEIEQAQDVNIPITPEDAADFLALKIDSYDPDDFYVVDDVSVNRHAVRFTLDGERFVVFLNKIH